MAHLRVEFAGLEFRNPVLISSSSLTNHPLKLKRLEEAGAGGVITKLASTAIPPVIDRTDFRAIVYKGGGWALTPGDHRLSLEEGVDLVRQAKKELRIPVIANVIGESTDEDSWVENALALQKAGADMLEMDLNCPIYHLDKDGTPVYTGQCVGQDPLLTGRITKSLKEAITIPVMPKLTPKMRDLVPIAKAAQDNKADAISAINVLAGFPSVDIRRGGKPFFLGIETRAGIEAQSHSIILGAPLNGVALWHTVHIAQHIDLPLCSGGGIMNWENAIERLMYGATTVQICSTVYLNGLRAVTQCVEGIESFLDEYGYKDCSQIMGKALDYVVESKDLVVLPLKAVITDPEKCIQCKDICVERVNASCLALSMKDHMAVVDEEKCTGCCLCYWFCPEGAVRMERKG